MKKYSKTGEYNIEEFTNRMRLIIFGCVSYVVQDVFLMKT
jgi:hypothetical protein